jgi:hypothetical protein
MDEEQTEQQQHDAWIDTTNDHLFGGELGD